MSDTEHTRIPRYLAWLLPVAIVLGLGWYKSAENRWGVDEQMALRTKAHRLEAESQTLYQELNVWAQGLYKATNPADEIFDKLNGGQPMNRERQGDYEVINWKRPEYGIRMEFTFSGQTLIGHGSHRSSVGLPGAQPETLRAQSGFAESVRRSILPYAVVLWFLALAAAITSRRHGRIASEAMFVVSLLCGAAWLVSPLYTLTPQGIFSNDPLVYALLMYVASLVVLVWRRPISASAKFQFRLQTLLAITGGVAVLLAMGEFGYVALAVFTVGAIFFGVALLWRTTAS
jgi:hypothetical protein